MESRIPSLSRTNRGGVDRSTTQTASQTLGHESQSRSTMEGIMRNILTSSSWFQEMITQTVEGCVGARLDGIRTDLEQLKADLTALRTDVESSDPQSWQQDKRRLDKDVDALRDFVQRSSEVIWQQIAQLEGRIPGQVPSPRTKVEEDAGMGSEDDRKTPSTSRAEKRLGRKSRRKKSPGRRKPKGRRRSSERSSDESDTTDGSDSHAESETDDIRITDRSCRKAMSVETYRLYDRATERSTRLNTTKMVNSVRHLFTGDRFDGSDPITVIHFLEEMKSALDEAEIAEGDAKHLVRYFLDGEAARLFKGLGSRDRSSYPRVLQWLLRTYVRETMLQNARENFLMRAQRSNESELDYSRELRVLARRCGGMIPEREVIHRFVRGLQPAIRTQVQMQVKRDTPWPTAVALAADFGNSHRDAMRVAKSRDESRLWTAPKRRSSEAGRTLMAQPDPTRQRVSSSEDDELLQFESLDDPEDGTTFAVLPPGSQVPSRVPSYLSISPGGGSSGSFRTARRSLSPASRTYVPPRGERKVMLPPGIPFPARQPSTNPKQVCWGCGLEGHFLSGCKTTDPRLIEMALEGFRSRKREREAQIPQIPGPAPQMPARAAGTAGGTPLTDRAPQSYSSPQPRVFVAKEDEQAAPEVVADDPAEEAKPL